MFFVSIKFILSTASIFFKNSDPAALRNDQLKLLSSKKWMLY